MDVLNVTARKWILIQTIKCFYLTFPSFIFEQLTDLNAIHLDISRDSWNNCVIGVLCKLLIKEFFVLYWFEKFSGIIEWLSGRKKKNADKREGLTP